MLTHKICCIFKRNLGNEYDFNWTIDNGQPKKIKKVLFFLFFVTNYIQYSPFGSSSNNIIYPLTRSTTTKTRTRKKIEKKKLKEKSSQEFYTTQNFESKHASARKYSVDVISPFLNQSNVLLWLKTPIARPFLLSRSVFCLLY